MTKQKNRSPKFDTDNGVLAFVRSSAMSAQFADKTEVRGTHLIWIGNIGKGDRPMAFATYLGRYRGISAVRASYLRSAKNPSQDRMDYKTTCGTPRCVNPRHIEATPYGQAPKRGLWAVLSSMFN